MKAFQHKLSMDEYDPLLAAYNNGNDNQRDTQQGKAWDEAHEHEEDLRQESIMSDESERQGAE